ncbi:MAG: TlpA family protein disulfide reductase [Bacteroidales bacterium]|nr:TlpA family protein disulfide reductase [Bacteroidales bacterium]
MKIRKKSALLLLCFTVFLTAGISGQSHLDTRFKELEGNQVTINELKGNKLTVVDFWATWCKPCLKSIPKLIELSKQYNSKEVSFIGVNEDSPRNTAKVRPFSASLGITYPVLFDPEQILMKDFYISVLPSLIILDGKGNIVYSHFGYSNGDEILIKEKIDELIKSDE